MTGLRTALERYLSMRKGFGYKYQHQARRLADFVSFMEERRATTITTKLAVAWATLPPDRHASWALRLTDVRGFARTARRGGSGIRVLRARDARPDVKLDPSYSAACSPSAPSAAVVTSKPSRSRRSRSISLTSALSSTRSTRSIAPTAAPSPAPSSAGKRTAAMDLSLSVRVDRGDRHAAVRGHRASA